MCAYSTMGKPLGIDLKCVHVIVDKVRNSFDVPFKVLDAIGGFSGIGKKGQGGGG